MHNKDYENRTEERRSEPPHKSVWWNKLSLAQKFSVSSLSKFGYQLEFIRHQNGHNLAVLTCNDAVAVVKEDGVIDTDSKIKLR